MKKHKWYPCHDDVYNQINHTDAEVIFKETIDPILRSYGLPCRNFIIEIQIGIRKYAYSTQYEDDSSIFMNDIVQHYKYLDPIKYFNARTKIMAHILGAKND